MRNNFVTALVAAAKQDPNIFLLTGDLGFAVLEPFSDAYPDRFINVGIAEQNMMGIAAGLALSGKKVFTYSIVNFAITRCLEQIRNDICYHNLDVTAVAVGGGVPYGTHGYTHQGVEDIAFTRHLPNMDVFSPADAVELRYCMSKVFAKNGPSYLRLARGGEPDVHTQEIDSDDGWIELMPQSDVNVVVLGTPLYDAMLAAKQLGEDGRKVGVFSVPHLTPALKDKLLALAKTSRELITVEEHLIEGGLGSFVAEMVAELPQHARLHRKGMSHHGLKQTGNQAYLRQVNGIDAESLASYLASCYA